MEELREFDNWIGALDLEWRDRERSASWKSALRNRADAGFLWARSRAEKTLRDAEKKAPLSEEEIAWFVTLEFNVEMLVTLAVSDSSEFFGEIWQAVESDLRLLSRAARLHISDDYLDKMRAQYEVGLFPNSL